MTYQFPEGFWWGSAASGPQTEGTFPGDKKGPVFGITGMSKNQENSLTV